MTSLDQKISIRRSKLGELFSSDASSIQDNEFNNYYSSRRINNASISSAPSDNSPDSSPYTTMSPWIHPSPYIKSPWTQQSAQNESKAEMDKLNLNSSKYGRIGSLYREEGHVYSIAASGDLLYTGSDSRNVRVWKGLRDFSGFKSSSGLVKAIVLFGDKIFTGHQDGKIRVWRFFGGTRNAHKRVGNLPTTRDLLRNSVNPKRYVEVRRNVSIPWIKHYDAVSCMSVDPDRGLLYSGSWDKTVKVWRISGSKCLESFNAHDDAVNSVLVAFDGLVLTCSADGTVKAWRRDLVGRCTKHVLVKTLLSQGQALTSLVASHAEGAVYVGSSDGLVSFWEREKHFICYGGVLRGHKLAVLCLAVAGDLVLSGSADCSICVWRREFGGAHAFVSVLTGHDEPVKCLAVQKEVGSEKDGRWIVYSGSLDKSVKVWRVSEVSHAKRKDNFLRDQAQGGAWNTIAAAVEDFRNGSILK